jgi:CheY-like chemotaxis protein
MSQPTIQSCVVLTAPGGLDRGHAVEDVMAAATEKRASILLVEDEPMVSEIATEALMEQGFEVRAVTNAGDALQFLTSGTPIDVLFTDVNLAGDMDGVALALRARELRPDLPVMYTSGKRSTIERMVPVEGSMFVPKPYDPFDVGQLLEYLVAAKKITQGIKTTGTI